MNKRLLLYTIAFTTLLTLSCSRNAMSDDYSADSDTLTCHAEYLTMYRRPDSVMIAEIRNPWDKKKFLARFALVQNDSVASTLKGSDLKIVKVPVEKAAVFSAVHTGLMKELGVLDALVAIADAQYFPKNDTVTHLLEAEKIYNLGSVNNPSVELIAASGAEIVLRSPVDGLSGSQLPTSVIPVECVDYMEQSPIGRSEWMLLYGELFGRGEQARALFDKVIDDYGRLVFQAKSSAIPNPKILVETETSGIWYVPAGDSYAVRLYTDAGADYPWKGSEGQGSLPLSLEEVAAAALDADMWLVRSYGYETTPESLVKLNPRYANFKALKDGNVYSCNSEARNVFAETSFHPELILADYISIFHPDVMDNYQRRYYIK